MLDVSASRMNKAVVVFVEERELVCQLTEDEIKLSAELYSVTPLGATTTKATVLNIPHFP